MQVLVVDYTESAYVDLLARHNCEIAEMVANANTLLVYVDEEMGQSNNGRRSGQIDRQKNKVSSL